MSPPNYNKKQLRTSVIIVSTEAGLKFLRVPGGISSFKSNPQQIIPHRTSVDPLELYWLLQ